MSTRLPVLPGWPDQVSVLRPGSVRVRAPASSANLGPGFDSLGLALALHDEVVAEVAGEACVVEVHGEGAADVPRDESHLVASALLTGLERWAGERPPGLRLTCRNRLPHGRGLGSSAAAVVSGLLAARGLLSEAERIGDEEVLDLANRIEGHPDNVAACLLGGLTVSWTDDTAARAVRLGLHQSVRAVLCVPAWPMSTQQARGLLPAQVPHVDAVFNSSRSALLVAALTREPGLLLTATEDRLHQLYRAPAMKPTSDLIAQLRSAGMAAVVSGAGPTVLVLGDGRTDAGVRSIAGPEWTVRALEIDTDGARAEYLATGTRWGL
jgi:homoserine kinase